MGGAEANVYASLALTTDVHQLLASQSGRFTPMVGSLGAPTNRKMGAPQSKSGGCGEQKNPFTPAGNRATVSVPVDPLLTDP
jgi:hypothetical protein